MSIPASSGSVPPSGGLPLVSQTLEPAWVRHGSAATQKSYQTALAFEEMLVEQLSKSLTATSGLGGEGGQEGEPSSEGTSETTGSGAGPLSSMLPQALTSGVMDGGGFGLAAQMTRQLEGAAGATQAATAGITGGTSATTVTPAGDNTDPNVGTATPAVGDTSVTGEATASGGVSA